MPSNSKPYIARNIGFTLSLLCLSVLQLEIALTRVFAALLQSHMVFMILSLTVCGLGIGGMLVSAILFYAPHSLRNQIQKPFFSELFICLFALSLYPMLLGILHTEDPLQNANLLNRYYLYLIFWATFPFVLAGVAISAIFEIYSDFAEELYFYDLAGASLGCLSVILLLEWLEGPISTILSIPFFLCLGLALLSQKTFKKSLAYSLGALLSGIFLYSASFSDNRSTDHPFTLNYLRVGTATAVGKALTKEEGQLVRTKWDSYSRTDLVEYPSTSRYFGEKQLFINTGKRARILKAEASVSSYKRDLAYLPFAYFQKRIETENRPYHVLNLGSGGGYDARLALFCQAQEITLVEINPLVVQFVEEEKEYAGDLFRRPNLHIFVDEGRSFIRKNPKTYDLIHSSLTSTLAVEESTQLSFYESYFYTQEALAEYLSKLNPDGMLSIIIERDDLRDKLIATFLALYQERGISPAQGMQHLALLHVPEAKAGAYSNLILAKNTPFSLEESARLEQLMPYWQGYLPQSPLSRFQQAPFFQIAEGKREVFGPQGWIETYQHEKQAMNIRPSTDDRPFFFHPHVGWDPRLTELAQQIFFYVVLLPLMLFFYPRKKVESQVPLWKFGIAFSLLGMGFMILEVALLKQFILYLSYPTLTLSTTLFGILFSAGVGAYLSQTFAPKQKLSMACFLLFFSVLLYSWLLPALIQKTLGMHTIWRCFICFCCVGWMGLLLGIPFPCLLRLLKRDHPGWVPLAFALNGGLSIFGSILMILIALSWGLLWTFWLGAFCYLLLPLLFYHERF